MEQFWILLIPTFAIVGVNLWHRNLTRDGGWHPYDHRRARRLLPDATWQYRPLTTSEIMEDAEDRAI